MSYEELEKERAFIILTGNWEEIRETMPSQWVAHKESRAWHTIHEAYLLEMEEREMA
jgi:hypothetical protein